MIYSSAISICITLTIYSRTRGQDTSETGKLDADGDGASLKQFKTFMLEHEKSYESFAEKFRRFKIFKNNLKTIERLNSDEEGDAVYGVTLFADMTHEEFVSMHSGLNIPDELRQRIMEETAMGRNLKKDDEKLDIFSGLASTKAPTKSPGPSPSPALFDWRTDNPAYPPIKDQKQCGSCWAFGTVGVIDILESKKLKRVSSYSEQQLVDCDKTYDGCDGGWFAFDFAKNPGLAKTSDYPYKGVNQTCPKALKSSIKIKSYTKVKPGDAAIIKALPTSPIGVAFDTSPDELMFYKGGIAAPKKCGTTLDDMNHAVIIIGHGTDYWIYRNSWGASYGEKGHVRIKKGLCAIGAVESYAATL